MAFKTGVKSIPTAGYNGAQYLEFLGQQDLPTSDFNPLGISKIYNIKKISTIFFSYKLCVSEKRTYLSKLEFPTLTVLLSIPLTLII